MIIFPKLPSAVQMSKYPQHIMHIEVMYGWTDRGHRTPDTTGHHHTFAPVDLTAPKVAAGKKTSASRNREWMVSVHPTAARRGRGSSQTKHSSCKREASKHLEREIVSDCRSSKISRNFSHFGTPAPGARVRKMMGRFLSSREIWQKIEMECRTK